MIVSSLTSELIDRLTLSVRERAGEITGLLSSEIAREAYARLTEICMFGLNHARAHATHHAITFMFIKQIMVIFNLNVRQVIIISAQYEYNMRINIYSTNSPK